MLFNKNENKPASSIEEKIKLYRRQGHIVPPRKIIKNAEQIEGIRESSKINTAVLDHVAANIREGMSTEDINTLVYDFTVSHGAIPAPLNYEGFPKSVCTSINEEVCHGIPDKNTILKSGDIINVDVSTIFNGYFSDASRMFMIGEVAEDRRKLVQVTKECLEKGIEVARPWGFLGLKFHEIPEVEHVGRRGTGMLLVPGMIFTIEPMINMGKRDIFIDEDNDWTVITEDNLPSAQWENTVLITETGVEILTW